MNRVSRVSRGFRFAPLLATLSIAMLAVGPLEEAGYGDLAASVALPVVLVGATYAIFRAGRWAWLVVGVWALMSLLESVLPIHPPRALAVAVRFGDTAFVAFVGVIVLHGVTQSRRVTLDTILGGISVYLFFGVFFTNVYSTLEMVAPGSFLDGGDPLREALGGSGHFPALSYFSLVTMTTLGYGDVAPVSALARSLAGAQAVIGQLYVAIMIAFLVGVSIAQRPGPPD